MGHPSGYASPGAWRQSACTLSASSPCGRATPDRAHWRLSMTTFDDREKSYEKKFAMDEELKFKAEARRNRLLAQWAGGKLGLSGAAIDDYVKAVRKADLAEKGDEDVFRKVKKDFQDKGVSVADSELRKAMTDFLAAAMQQIADEAKGKAS